MGHQLADDISNSIPWMKIVQYGWNVAEHRSIGLDNSLAPNRHQVIT